MAKLVLLMAKGLLFFFENSPEQSLRRLGHEVRFERLPWRSVEVLQLCLREKAKEPIASCKPLPLPLTGQVQLRYYPSTLW